MDGFGLVRAIRADAAVAETPVILLTARGPDHRMETGEGGADTYLTKPFQPSELRAAVESLLRKRERLLEGARDDRDAALRILAEGAAHEVLNPLGFLQSALYVLRELATELLEKAGKAGVSGIEPRSVEAEIARTYAAGIEGVARVRAVVESLRRFSIGGGMDDRSSDNVNDIVRRVSTLVTVRGVGMSINSSLRATRLVEVRRGELEQVLLNIFLNARRAAGEGCKLDVETWDHERGGVAVSVGDNGPGVPVSERDKIFLPFYTSRPTEGGSGLGLAVARRIVRDHGGTIDVGENPTGGALFTLWLPASMDSPPESRAPAGGGDCSSRRLSRS
jgi:two-component system NtrC family sensor kinase